MPCAASMEARLKTTPRVGRSFSWHWRLLLHGRFHQLQRSELRPGCNKPDGDPPTHPDRKVQTWRRRTPPSALLLFPLLHRHCCPPARLGGNFKFVHESPHSGQAEPETSRSGEAIAQGLGNVWNARTMI